MLPDIERIVANGGSVPGRATRLDVGQAAPKPGKLGKRRRGDGRSLLLLDMSSSQGTATKLTTKVGAEVGTGTKTKAEAEVEKATGCKGFCSWYANPHRHFDKHGELYVKRVRRSITDTAAIAKAVKSTFAGITDGGVLKVWKSCDEQLERGKPKWELPLGAVDGDGEDFRAGLQGGGGAAGGDELHCTRYAIQKETTYFASLFASDKDLVLCSVAPQTVRGWKKAIEKQQQGPAKKRRKLNK